MISLNTLCSAIALTSSGLIPSTSAQSNSNLSAANSASSSEKKQKIRSNFSTCQRIKRRLPVQFKVNKKKQKNTEMSTPELSPNSPSISDSSEGVFDLNFARQPENRQGQNVDIDLTIPQEDKNNSANPEQIDLANLNFTEWLEHKRKSFTRKRNLLVEEEYDILIVILKQIKNETLDIRNPELRWGRPLINSTGFEVVSVLNNETVPGITETIVKKRYHEGFEVRIQEERRKFGLPHDLLTPLLLRQFYMQLPRFSELESIVRRYHLGAGHASPRDMYAKLKTRYMYITREMCEEWKKRCDICKRTEPIKKKAQPPLMPIDGKDTFHHVQLDLIDYNNKRAGPNKEYGYICHVIDHVSTYHYTEAIREKSAIEVLHVLRKFFAVFGFPNVVHSDNGGEFRNSEIQKYLEHHQIQFVHGKPYTPQTQGKVERANRTLKEVIRKLVAESRNTKSWFDVMYEATLCVNTNLSRAIRKSPYHHVFCMDPPNVGNIGEFQQAHDKVDHNLQEEHRKELENAEDDDKGYDSPGVAEIDHTFHYDDRAGKIRADSRVHYEANMKVISQAHLKHKNAREYRVGDLIGIILPDEYKSKNFNKLPAMIIQVKEKDKTKFYRLAYDIYILEKSFFQHEMIPLVGPKHYYENIVKETPEQYKKNMMQLLKDKTYMTVSLKTACEFYQECIYDCDDTESAEEEVTMDEQNKKKVEQTPSNTTPSSIPQPVQLDATISNKLTLTTRSIKVSIVNRKCCVCEQEITANQQQDKECYQCKRRMHAISECEFKVVHFPYMNKTYCTQTCYLMQENYPVEILKENRSKKHKKYFVRYKSGTEIWITARKVENSLDFAKPYLQYLSLHATPLLHKNSNNVNDDNKEDEVQIISSTGPEDKCCVCDGILTAANWHRCHYDQCKRRLHGKIICDKGERIVQDDDQLYCCAEHAEKASQM